MEKQLLLFKAMQFANRAHRKQQRKLFPDEPYIFHPFHTFYLLVEYGEENTTTLIVAILHDTLEDNPEEVSFELIEKEFGKEVADGVLGVTLDAANPNKRASRMKILNGSRMCRFVKVADVLSHLIALIATINELGVEETQKRHKMPLEEKIKMEREFLLGALQRRDQEGILHKMASDGLVATCTIEELQGLGKGE